MLHALWAATKGERGLWNYPALYGADTPLEAAWVPGVYLLGPANVQWVWQKETQRLVLSL